MKDLPEGFTIRGASSEPTNPQSTLTQRSTELPEGFVVRGATQQEQTQVPKEPSIYEDPSWMEDTAMSARMFLQGISMGWSDEAWAASQAAAESVMYGVDYKQTYDNVLAQSGAEMKAYEERKPVQSFAEKATGAVAPFAIPVVGQAAGALTAGGRVLLASLEGALGATGQAEQGEDLVKKAGQGFVLGGIGQGAFEGIFKAFKQLSKQRLETPIENIDPETGEKVITPLTIALPKGDFLQSFYQNVVGSSFGKKRLQEQEAVFVTPVEETLVALEKNIHDTGVLLKEAKQTHSANMTKFKNQADDTFTAGKDVLKDKERAVVEELAKQEKGILTKNVADSALALDNLTNDILNGFRSKAFLKAAPTDISKESLEKIVVAGNSNAAEEMLSDAWINHGFAALKKGSFTFNAGEMTSNLVNRLKNPLFAGMDRASFDATLTDTLENITKFTKKGVISGENLAGIRTTISSIARTKTDIRERDALNNILDYVNGTIRKQLPPGDLQKFDNELLAWKTNVILRDAVTSASGKAGSRGDFSLDQWKQAIKKNSKVDARKNKGVLGEEADAAHELVKANEKSLGRTSEAFSERIANDAKKRIANEKGQIAKQIRLLEKEKRTVKDNLPTDSKLLGQVRLYEDKIKELKGEWEISKGKAIDLNEKVTPRSSNIFRTLAVSGILSPSQVPNDFGVAPMLASALTAGQLSKPGVMKTLVGQGDWQKSLRAGAEGMLAQGTKTALPGITGLLAAELAKDKM